MLSDPIVALATPPGRSALAVIRLSGRGAFDVAGRVVDGFRTHPPRQARLATFRNAAGTAVDRGLYTVFPAPRSYTGEDLVELSCHGGLAVPAQLLAALAQLEGGLSRRLGELRERLIELQSLLGYDIDFPGEDDGPVAPARIAAALEEAAQRVEDLLATAPSGERLREGALVVFAGRPNTGKSSLFNALLGAERALVTDIPGTTRDTIEAHTDFLGWPVRLADTAGLQDATDRVERLGIEVSLRYLAAADLVLLCSEAGRPLG